VLLHAAKLSFPHPAGGTKVVEAPWPDEFAAAAEAAGLRR
jgi:23S rRNA pseudouridine955/2504/2580 synthase